MLTGYNGFIGSNLVEVLLKKHQIIGISNSPHKMSSVLSLKKDIRRINTNDIQKNIQHVIHLAAMTDVESCQNNPTECFDVNVKGTQNVLEIARKLDSKFVYLSTSHVYGIPKKIPIDEDHPRNPISTYAASKLGGEIICESYAKTYGMDVSILRLFSIYGPQSPLHLVTSKIILQLLTKNIIQLGNTFPRRDFVYVTDVVNAINLVLRKLHGFNIYNVGSGKSYSILELCNISRRIAGRNIPIKSIKSKMRRGEINNIVSDITRIRKLGWHATVDIEKGLQMTFDWFLSNMQIFPK